MAIFEKKLFFVLSFVLVSNKNALTETNIKLYGWEVLIGDKYLNISGECDGLFVKPQVFITDADCFVE